MLVFSNPGEIDPRLITTFGANVKVGPSAIGHFGTGLKYAIAVVLRTGGTIEIVSGSSTYTFGTQKDSIRGKSFEFVTMNGEPTGFTTELGKNWEPWMAYRELWSNAKDEGGGVQQVHVAVPSGTGTEIFVSGLDEVHANRDQYFLREGLTPVAESPACQIFPGPSSSIFYQGIKVATLDKPSRFTYNLLTASLTEDRTLTSLSSAYHPIVSTLCGHAPPSVLDRTILDTEGAFEEDLSWYTATWGENSPAFRETIIRHGRNKSVVLPTYLKGIFRDLSPEDSMPRAVEPTALESRVLTRAFDLLERLGWTIVNPILVVESLGEIGERTTTLGLAFAGKIWISRSAFRKGLHAVAQVLLEEHLHLQMGYDDCSRNMQNYLFEMVIRLGGEVLGEVL